MSKTIIAKERVDEPITGEVLRAAIERGRQRSSPELHARTIAYLADSKALMIGFGDDSAVVLPLKNYPELASLTKADIARLTLGFAGSALCLEGRDLHISIAGMIAANEPLMSMASIMIASRNGSRITEAKTKASRANGLKGGRPRKALDTA
jgi:hypothetical protein